MIPLELIRALPHTYRVTIPETFLDEMGHMNIQWYIHIFDRAAWGAFGLVGATLERMESKQEGVFALEQHIRYLAEVRVGQTVSVYTRFLGRSEKRLHFIHFMVNEDREMLSSTIEGIAMYMNMAERRSTLWAGDIQSKLDEILEKHQVLDWEAPLCGSMKP